MKPLVSRILALVLVVAIALVGCSTGGKSGLLTGNYSEDTLIVVESLRNAVALPDDSPEKAPAQARSRDLINDFVSRYRRDGSVSNLVSFTTMRTALGSLAGHYSSYPTSPVPESLKKRLEQQFLQVEVYLRRGT